MDKQQLQYDGSDEKTLNKQKPQGSIFESLLERLPWNQSLDQGRINFQRQKEESLCRDKFRALLRQHPNVFSSFASGDVDPSLYAAESAILKNVMQAERVAFAYGFLTFIATFLTVRYGPTYFIKTFGGEARAKALQESQKLFNEQNNNILGHTAQLMVAVMQAAMAGWVGKRTYETISTRQESNFSQIASIPLVPGRSALSDALCSSWVEAYRDVPLSFWKEKSTDKREFNTIRLFAINCLQRQEYEKRLLRQRQPNAQEDESTAEVHIPLPLPVDKVVRLEDVLSNEEVDLFMSDRKD
jgi:hypothetical protein